MAQNNRYEGNAIYPIDPKLQRDEVPTAAQEQQDRIQSNGKIQLKRTTEIDSDQPVTVTTTTAKGAATDFIPTLIPALQSSAYVLVILGGFLAWSSRKLLIDFCQKHIALVETLRENLDEQLVTTTAQLAVLQQLAHNNEKLVNTVANIAERNVLPQTTTQRENTNT